MGVANLSTVDVDLACIGCGYNLRTLPWEGRCPECTRPVKESVGGWGPVLTSRASVVKLLRAIGFLFAAVVLEMFFEVALRIAAIFSMQLMESGWYKFFLYPWIDGGALARLLGEIAIILILFACTPRHASRLRGWAWAGIPFALGFSVIEAFWLVGFHFPQFSNVQNTAQSILAFSTVGGIMAVVLMWLLLRLVVPREKHPCLSQLCLLAVVSSLIRFVSPLLNDLPNYFGLEPIIEPETYLFLGPRAFGGCGVVEATAIFQLGVLWIFVRALQDSCHGKRPAKLYSVIEHSNRFEANRSSRQS